MSVATVLEPQLAPGRRSAAWRDDPWPAIPPTLVTIHRRSPRDEGSRQVVCKLDGQLVGELLFGQSHTVETWPGEHELFVHNTLMWRRVRFEVAPGGHVHFTVVNRAPAGFYFLLLTIGVAPLILSVERGAPL